MRDLFKNVSWRNHTTGLSIILGSFVLLMGAIVNYFDSKEALNEAESSLNTQQLQMADAQNSEDILIDVLDDYRKLIDRGYVGEPNRLQWVETVQSLALELGIPDVKFTLLDSHMALAVDSVYFDQTVSLRMTKMEIIMQLAHEGDLVLLLTGMRTRAKGMFDVEYCDLKWQADSNDEESLTRLNGECTLQWLTLVDATASWGDMTP